VIFLGFFCICVTPEFPPYLFAYVIKVDNPAATNKKRYGDKGSPGRSEAFKKLAIEMYSCSEDMEDTEHNP
jgi:hypothetical protein